MNNSNCYLGFDKARCMETRTILQLGVLLLSSSAFLLGGCASSSGVRSYGAETHRVEGSSEFGLASAKDAALKDAAEFCSSSNQAVHELSSRSDSHVDAFGDRVETWELIFQCAAPGSAVARTGVDRRQVEREPDPRDIRSDIEIQALTREYDRCTVAGVNDQAVVSACTGALRLDPSGTLLTPEARIDVFFNRSLAYARMGGLGQAISDMESVLRVNSGDREARSLLADMNADLAARNAPPLTYRLYYEGLFCALLPRDSIIYPASELFLTTAVQPTGSPDRMETRLLPRNSKYYANVKSGTAIKTKRAEIWSGPDRFVDVAVTLWEHDGELGLVGTYAVMAGVALLTRGKGKTTSIYSRPGRTVGRPKGERNYNEDPIDPDQVSALAPLVGGGHDLFGAVRFRNLDAAGWSETALRNDAGIRHHIVGSLRGGGADCRVYLRFAAD